MLCDALPERIRQARTRRIAKSSESESKLLEARVQVEVFASGFIVEYDPFTRRYVVTTGGKYPPNPYASRPSPFQQHAAEIEARRRYIAEVQPYRGAFRGSLDLISYYSSLRD
jgi:hypothetical protein